jgi:hypothetical protein
LYTDVCCSPTAKPLRASTWRSISSQGSSIRGEPRRAPEGSRRGLPRRACSATLGLIYARLVARDDRSLLKLLNPVMSTIVLPYLGGAEALRELERTGRVTLPRVVKR